MEYRRKFIFCLNYIVHRDSRKKKKIIYQPLQRFLHQASNYITTTVQFFGYSTQISQSRTLSMLRSFADLRRGNTRTSTIFIVSPFSCITAPKCSLSKDHLPLLLFVKRPQAQKRFSWTTHPKIHHGIPLLSHGCKWRAQIMTFLQTKNSYFVILILGYQLVSNGDINLNVVVDVISLKCRGGINMQKYTILSEKIRSELFY